MNRRHPIRSLGLGASLGLCGVLCCGPLAAAGPAASGAAVDAAARYKQERAACLDGSAGQDRDACLREAVAAQARSRRGVATPDADAAALQRNATKRCDALPDDDRKACMARMQGKGSTSGSVAGGGILRELVTVTPTGAASAATPASRSSAP